MKKNILNSLLILNVMFFALACKPKREVVVAPAVKQENKTDHSKTEALTLLSGKQFKFNTLALKAKANLDIDGNANDVGMNIRIKNNETIWVIVTAVGGMVEVARALITPDSIKIIDKMKNQYIKKPFSYIYSFTNKQINFNTVQSVLTGNAISEFLNEKSDVKMENGVWTVAGSNQDLDYRILFNTLFKVAETNLNDAKSGQALKVTYDAYQKINTSLFPGSMVINTMSEDKKINLNLTFTKIEGNVAVDFPFTVPKRFVLVD